MKTKTNFIILTAVFLSLGILIYKVKESLIQKDEKVENYANLKSLPPEISEEVKPLLSPHSEPFSPSNAKGEEKLIPINFNSNEIPNYFEIIDEVDPEMLKKILDSAEQIHFSLQDERFKGETNWMRGLYLGTIAFQLQPNELPKKGYISEDFFFYLKRGVSRFSEGFAVNRKNGKIFKWDISQ